MKELLKSNIYDVSETIIVVGSCLKNMQSKGYEELKKISNNIYELCLEETHINMAITKLLGMIRARKISKVIFASVDKSPHCIQLHYLQEEITKLGFEIEFVNYVSVDNKLIKINKETITLSKQDKLIVVNY